MIRTLLFAGAALMTASCATADQTAAAQPAGARDCFHANSVNGFSVLDSHTVKVNVGASRAYGLTLMSDARDLNFNERLGLESDTRWICTGNGLGVQVHSLDRSFPRSWQVTAVARLPDADPQAAAAPEGS